MVIGPEGTIYIYNGSIIMILHSDPIFVGLVWGNFHRKLLFMVKHVISVVFSGEDVPLIIQSNDTSNDQNGSKTLIQIYNDVKCP